MKMRRLGAKGPEVSAIGLGCMGMTDIYGAADEGEAIATIHAALDAGVTLIDTGDFYAMGANEMLVGRALKGRRDKAFVQVKFGAQRDPSGAWIGYDARPSAVASSSRTPALTSHSRKSSSIRPRLNRSRRRRCERMISLRNRRSS